jgi:hypothetical protein
MARRQWSAYLRMLLQILGCCIPQARVCSASIASLHRCNGARTCRPRSLGGHTVGAQAGEWKNSGKPTRWACAGRNTSARRAKREFTWADTNQDGQVHQPVLLACADICLAQ